MSEDNTQTVVDDTKASAKPDAAADNARVETDDLDTLLSQFDEGGEGSTDTKPKPDKTSETTVDPAVKQRLDQLEKKLADDEFQKQITPVIQKVRGDISPDVLDDSEVLDWMEGRAKRDPRLRAAWIDRSKNPKAWDKVVDALGRELHKKFTKLPDAHATEDRAAVAASVRGASTQAPEGKAPDFSQMPTNEYREEHKKLYGYYPNV